MFISTADNVYLFDKDHICPHIMFTGKY